MTGTIRLKLSRPNIFSAPLGFKTFSLKIQTKNNYLNLLLSVKLLETLLIFLLFKYSFRKDKFNFCTRISRLIHRSFNMNDVTKYIFISVFFECDNNIYVFFFSEHKWLQVTTRPYPVPTSIGNLC